MVLECCDGVGYVGVRVIARELGLTVQAVCQYLKRRGIKPYRVDGAYRLGVYGRFDVRMAYRDYRKRYRGD